MKILFIIIALVFFPFAFIYAYKIRKARKQKRENDIEKDIPDFKERSKPKYAGTISWYKARNYKTLLFVPFLFSCSYHITGTVTAINKNVITVNHVIKFTTKATQPEVGAKVTLTFTRNKKKVNSKIVKP